LGVEKSDSPGTGRTGESWRLRLRVRAEKGREKRLGRPGVKSSMVVAIREEVKGRNQVSRW
jgi:hypothetical protein